ncbi:hypothetical protein B0H11DRAFT_1923888 [Mycena galericulata]|nr:hypothetical protein B0H11DRAFT_1923888 [Mycena galericulata]
MARKFRIDQGYLNIDSTAQKERLGISWEFSFPGGRCDVEGVDGLLIAFFPYFLCLRTLLIFGLPIAEEGVEVIAGQAVVVGEGGARVERNAEAEDADPEVVAVGEKKKKKRKAARQSASDALEASFLSKFACTKLCWRITSAYVISDRSFIKRDEHFESACNGQRHLDEQHLIVAVLN